MSVEPDVSPVVKRQRTEADTGVSEAPPVRSTIWLEDGNVVLQVQNTQFRVHRSMLSLHSSVFRDMFQFPQPFGEHDVDGCPVVHLTDDPDDFEQLLKVVYDRSGHLLSDIGDAFLIANLISPFTSDTAQPLELIAAMLRLGRKYDFTSFHREAIKLLSEELPSTFPSWRERVKSSRVKYYAGVEFDLVAVVRENELHSLLPAALFDCHRYSMVFAFCVKCKKYHS